MHTILMEALDNCLKFLNESHTPVHVRQGGISNFLKNNAMVPFSWSFVAAIASYFPN